MTTQSKAQNIKRRKAEEACYTILNDLDPSGINSDVWSYRFSKLNDKEFTKLMENWRDNPNKFHLHIEQDPRNKKTMVTFERLKEVAKKHKIDLYEHVFFPHETKDPERPFVTADKVPILYMYVRKLQQMLSKKNDASGDIDSVNPLIGQVTGDSKSAAIGDMQTASLVTTNQQDAIREFLTIRADNLPAKNRMLSIIEKNGTVNYSDCDVKLKDNQSLQTLWVFMTGALLKTDLLD
jgi:hypothetical protein